MDEGVQVMIFMGLILKIPVAFAVWLIWWALKSQPDPAEASEDDGGQRSSRFRRPLPKRPRGPRRGGPHTPGSLPLPCPEEGSLRTRPALAPQPLTAAARRARGD